MFELEEQIRTALQAHEDRETARLDALATKVDALSDRHAAATLASQQALTDVRLELNSLSHVVGSVHERVERMTHVVCGNGREGLDARVLKIEEALKLVATRGARQAAALWTVAGGVVVYLCTTLLGKLF